MGKSAVVPARAALAATLCGLLAAPAHAQGDAPPSVVGTMPNLIMIGLILIAGGASVWLLNAARRGKKRALASLEWPQIEGKVIESRLTQRIGGAEGGDTVYYRPHIRYSYEIGGHPYLGDTVRFGNLETTSTNKAQAYLTKYPQGAKVSVRYDPADPKVATLETEAATGGLLALGILMTVMTVACIGLLGYFLTLG
jgi:hypothetical protein